jgi:hypothetical protein
MLEVARRQALGSKDRLAFLKYSRGAFNCSQGFLVQFFWAAQVAILNGTMKLLSSHIWMKHVNLDEKTFLIKSMYIHPKYSDTIPR